MIEVISNALGTTLIVLLAVALSVATWHLYRQELMNSGRSYAWLLPWLRGGAIAAVVLMLMQPALRYRRTSGELGRIQIVLDASQSMELPKLDAGRDLPRFSRAVQYFAVGRDPLLSPLSKRHEIRFSYWNGSLTKLWESNARRQDDLPVRPEDWSPSQYGSTTNLSEALRSISASTEENILENIEPEGKRSTDWKEASPQASRRSERGLPPVQLMSPIVLISDGKHNAGPTPLDVAEQLKKFGKPVFAIAMGSETAPTDLALIAVDAPQSLLRTDTLRGTIRLRTSLPVGTTCRARIEYQGREVWLEHFATSSDRVQSVDFAVDLKDLIPEDRSSMLETLKLNRIPLDLVAQVLVDGELDGVDAVAEATLENNTKSFRVSATARRQKVLLLDSESRWEFRYLRNALERDPNWEVDSFLILSNGDKRWFGQTSSSASFPSTFEDWLKYDLVFLGDLARGSLDARSQEWLKRTVEQGGCGLVIIDGLQSAWSQSEFLELATMLPVAVKSEGQERGPFAVKLSDAGDRLAAFQLGKEANVGLNTDSVWKSLPELQGAKRVEALAGSEVLVGLTRSLEANSTESSMLPFAVTRLFGAGRVLYFSSDETWRWRYRVADQYHQQFWNQVARWVMRYPYAVESEFALLDVRHSEYALGEPVEVRAKLRDSDGNALHSEWVNAVLENVEHQGQEVGALTLRPDPNLPGVYHGEFAQLSSGDYTVRIQAAGMPKDALPANVSFSVAAPASDELLDLSCDRELLRQIADRSGGAFLDESEIERLPELLEVFSQGRIENVKLTIWSSYYWFVPIVCFLGAEWWLRKRVGLP